MSKIPFPRLNSPGAYLYQTGAKISLILGRLNKQKLLSLLTSFCQFRPFYFSVHSKPKVLWPSPKSAEFDGNVSVGLNRFWSRAVGNNIFTQVSHPLSRERNINN